MSLKTAVTFQAGVSGDINERCRHIRKMLGKRRSGQPGLGACIWEVLVGGAAMRLEEIRGEVKVNHPHTEGRTKDAFNKAINETINNKTVGWIIGSRRERGTQLKDTVYFLVDSRLREYNDYP